MLELLSSIYDLGKSHGYSYAMFDIHSKAKQKNFSEAERKYALGDLDLALESGDNLLKKKIEEETLWK